MREREPTRSCHDVSRSERCVECYRCHAGGWRTAIARWQALRPLAQPKADTLITDGKILTVDAKFSTVQALAIKDGRIIARGTQRGDEALCRAEDEDHRRARARRSSPASSTIISTSPARCRPGTSRRGSRASARARKRSPSSPPRPPASGAASGSWCRADGRRASSRMRPAASRSRRLDRVAPQQSALRAGRLCDGLCQQPGAEGGRARPEGWRQAARSRPRLLPAALCALRRDAQDVVRPSSTATLPTICAS